MRFYTALGVLGVLLLLCAFVGPRRSAPELQPGPSWHPIMAHGTDGLPPGTKAETNLVYHSVNGVDVYLDVLTPPGAHYAPLVVWFHGGGFQRGERWPLGRGGYEMLQAGFVVATVDYRLAPQWKWPCQLEDARAAIRFLRRYATHWGADPARIGVWGHSTGGTLAELLALEGISEHRCPNRLILPQDAVQAVVALSARTDFLNPQMCEQSRQSFALAFDPAGGQEVLREASPLFHTSGDPLPPMLLIHGRADRVVPFNDAVRLHDRLTIEGQDVEFGAYDVAHETDVTPPDISERIVEFFSRTLAL